MQVNETNADGLKHEFKVVVPAEQIETRTQDRLAEIAKTVKLPGFRPGKVPMKILRQKYLSSIMGEVLEAAVNDGVSQAVSSKSLRPAMQPKVEVTSFDEGKDLEFTVAVEVLPEISPVDFATISLEREKAEVPEADIAEALARIAEHNETSEAVERAAQSGDIVNIDFLGKKDGVAFDGGAAQGYDLKLGSNTFIPGFEDQLIGKNVGEDVLVNVTFPEAYGNEELAGAAVTFDVKINAVKEAKPAEINDELAKQLGMDSLDAVKDRIREEISRELDSLSRARVKRKLLDALAEAHDFEVPAGMVDQEFDAIWKQVEADREAGRVDPSDEGKDDETLKADYRGLAERRVRLGLLLADVGQKNSITVSQEDVNKALLNEARRFPGQERLVFQYYQSNPEALNALRAPVFEDKVVDFILELAKVTDKVVSVEDLRKEPEEGEASEDKPKKKAAKKKAE